MPELNEFEKEVHDWLSKPLTERNLEVGAKLLLQISRNQILHRNVIRKENFDKIEYVLRNYIGNKAPEVIEVPTVNPQLAAFEKISEKIEGKFEGKGKRADHDQLPDFIQAIPEANTVIYQKIRSLHERLKILSTQNSTSAERLPFVIELMSLDSELTNNWEAYDSFDLASYDPNKKVERLDIKQIQAHRTYLSRLKEEPLSEKALEDAQNRYNELILDGQNVSPKITEKLKALGVITMEVKETEEIPPVVENLPAGENTEVTPAAAVTETTDTDSSVETSEENVISQIKTLLKNNVEKENVISTIASLGTFNGLELTPEVVEDLYNKAVEQEINEEIE